MKSRNDFNTKAEYKEYLYAYYSPICLQSISNVGMVELSTMFTSAMDMAKKMVEAISPEDKEIPLKNNARPVFVSKLEELVAQNSRNKEEALQRIFDRRVSDEEIEKLVEANKRWYENHIEKKGTGSNATNTTGSKNKKYTL